MSGRQRVADRRPIRGGRLLGEHIDGITSAGNVNQKGEEMLSTRRLAATAMTLLTTLVVLPLVIAPAPASADSPWDTPIGRSTELAISVMGSGMAEDR
jgi:hypothetical protein